MSHPLLDKPKKLNFKILRSCDHNSCILFAVFKLNCSCYVLLAGLNMYCIQPKDWYFYLIRFVFGLNWDV